MPDTEGFKHWFNELFDGVMPFSKLVYAIANGALDNDQVVLNNKVASALYFNQMLDVTGSDAPSLVTMQQAVRGVTSDTTLLAAKLSTDAYTGASQSALTNTTIFDGGTFITGVRAEYDGHVILTGNQTIEGSSHTQAILYRGPMKDTTLTTTYALNPKFEGQEVVSATFMGLTPAGIVDQSFVSQAGGLLMPMGASNFTYSQTALGSTGAVIVGASNAGNVLGGSIGNDTFKGVQFSNATDTIFTGGGADQIVLYGDRTATSHIALYASNMTRDLSKVVAGDVLPSIDGSIVNAEDIPQLGWWGQGSGKLGGPISDAATNAGAGTGTSGSLTNIYNFQSGSDLSEIDRLDFSLSAFSELLRDMTPGSGPSLGQAVFSNPLTPGDAVTVVNANVLLFDSATTFKDAGALAAILADAQTHIEFNFLQTDTFNHYLVAYQDTTGSTRIADLNIRSEADFINTAVVANKTVSVSDMVRLVDVSIAQLYDGNLHFVS